MSRQKRASGSSGVEIMKTTVTLSSFKQAFQDAGRGDHFSWEGLEVLFDYLEELEEGTGTEMELDAIALCCDFVEEAPEAIAATFGITSTPGTDITEDGVMNWLQDRTMVVGKTTSGIIYNRGF
jgi:hypothetical protein